MAYDRHASRYGRILLVLLMFGGFGMIGAAWWYYVLQRSAVEQDAYRQLAAITETKARQVENWRAERIGDGHVLRSAPVMSQVIAVLKGNNARARNALTELLVAMEREFLYSNATVLDAKGQPVLQLHSDASESKELKPVLDSATRTQTIVLSPLYRSSSSQQLSMTLMVPVPGGGGLAMNIDPQRFLFPYVRTWPLTSASAETELVAAEGDWVYYLSELRHRTGAGAPVKRSLKDLRLPPAEQRRKGWRLNDYRGVPVLAVSQGIAGSDWVLISKVDTAEVFEPVRRLFWEMAVVMAMIVIAILTGAGLVWRGEQLRAYAERKALVGHFNSLTKYANDIIFLADESGMIVEANERALQTYGYSQVELMGMRIADLQETAAPGMGAEEHEEGDRFESLHRTKNGRLFSVDVSSRAIAVEGLRYTQSIIRDISDRVRAEREARELSSRLINAQEEERSRIARELHDDLSQQVAAVSIGMSNLKRQISSGKPEAAEHSDRIQQKLVRIANCIRDISHQLHPALLEHSGLLAALRTCCSEFNSMTGIRAPLDAKGSLEDVSKLVALSMFRITQEALRNVAKHAGATEVSVQIIREESGLVLSIKDNGSGFDVPNAEAAKGLGLISIKERVRLLGGTLSIQSTSGVGTVLTVSCKLS